MNEIMYTNEGIAWAYKPLVETDPVKIAERERKFQDLFERLEANMKKDRLLKQTV